MLVKPRRPIDPERVRHALREMPDELLANEYGEHIVFLRGAIYEAIGTLEDGQTAEALQILRRALEERAR